MSRETNKERRELLLHGGDLTKFLTQEIKLGKWGPVFRSGMTCEQGMVSVVSFPEILTEIKAGHALTPRGGTGGFQLLGCQKEQLDETRGEM